MRSKDILYTLVAVSIVGAITMCVAMQTASIINTNPALVMGF